jgi:conjugal transfer mating pair stabilization protein TraN
VVTQQRSTTIDPKSINLSNAQAIAADPTGYAGISTSGSQGSCQTVQATAGNTSTYYDSCQIGSTEQDSSFTCTVGWRDVVSTTSTYSCEQKVISGINAGQATQVETLDSCTQLAALATCSKTGSSSVSGAEHYGTAGSGSIYQPPTIQFPSYSVDTNTSTYSCSQAVAVGPVTSATLTDWSSQGADGVPVLGSFSVTASAQQTGSTAKLVSSTVDDSACKAQVGTITCPGGTSLTNGQCVSTVPATQSIPARRAGHSAKPPAPSSRSQPPLSPATIARPITRLPAPTASRRSPLGSAAIPARAATHSMGRHVFRR